MSDFTTWSRNIRYFDCSRCGRTNPDFLTFGVGADRHYCLGHIPRMVRVRMWLRERLVRQ